MLKNVILTIMVFASVGLYAQSGDKLIELDEIVNGDFSQKELPSITFMADGAHFARLEDRQRIVKYALKSGEEVATMMSSDRLTWDGEIADFSLSKDNNYILFYTQKEKLYRHSFKAIYYLYDIRLKKLTPLGDGERIRAATMSPDASKIAFVKENNIYIYNASFGTTRQVTEDGELNKVINGVPDWVYEEEFSTNRLMEWSPDSRFLAWMRFDETLVPEFSFPLYQDFGLENGYLDKYVYKYPKAGATNSIVTAHVFDYTNKVSRKMKIDIEEEGTYLPRLFWSNSAEKLGIARLNRHQNNLQILFANPKSGICTIAISEDDERYIDQQAYSEIEFLDDGVHFVYQSERDGFNHLYLYTLNGRLVKQLTKGDFDVTAFYGYDAKGKTYYYQAAKKSPLEREVYALNAKDVVTSITPTVGTNEVTFSPTYAYSIRSNTSVNSAFSAHVFDRKSIQLYDLEKNDELGDMLKDYKLSNKEFFTFTTPNGDELNGWQVKPLDFDESIQYPVVMLQYSGPGSQKVSDSYSLGWEQYLARLGYMVVCVDGRGTGFRGADFKKCTYLQLGRYESDDQISAAKHLAQLPYVDGDRIAIWGWSYGGFMSSLCLSRSEGVFKAGIAVAPVTHYKFYDTAYTERFMRTPKENEDGYNKYSPLMLAEQLQGKLLLCHGTADDNVHYQNTLDYAEALVQAGKQFDMQIYRNRDHSISGGNTRLHIYTRFVDFLEKNL